MSQHTDNKGNALPPFDEIITTWLTPPQVARMHGVTERAIQKACAEGRLRAVKFGDRFRGSWYVHPEAAAEFDIQPRRPFKDEERKNGKEDDEG